MVPVSVKSDDSSRAMPKSTTLSDPFRKQKDVGRLEVPVHDPVLVRVRQRAKQLRHDPDGVVECEPRSPLQHRAEIPSRDVFHDDVRRSGLFAVVVNRHDMGMREPARGLRLAPEARQHLGKLDNAEDVGAENLDRHAPADRRVKTLVHGAHRSAADLPADLVLAYFSEHRPTSRRLCAAVPPSASSKRLPS